MSFCISSSIEWWPLASSGTICSGVDLNSSLYPFTTWITHWSDVIWSQLCRQSGRRPAVGRSEMPGVSEKPFIKVCKVTVCIVPLSLLVWELSLFLPFPLELRRVRLLAPAVPAAIFCRDALLQKTAKVLWVSFEDVYEVLHSLLQLLLLRPSVLQFFLWLSLRSPHQTRLSPSPSPCSPLYHLVEPQCQGWPWTKRHASFLAR